MNIRIPASGAAAKQARAYLASQGITVSHTQALEMVARLHGYTDLQAMKADENMRYADPHALLSESSDEYVLKPGQNSAWITVDDVTVYVRRAEDSVEVELFRLNDENGPALDTASASTFGGSEEQRRAVEQLKATMLWHGLYEPLAFASLLEDFGVERLPDYLWAAHRIVFRAGAFAVFSAEHQGYWTGNPQVWAPVPFAAQVFFDAKDSVTHLAPDAVLVPYEMLGEQLEAAHEEAILRMVLQLELNGGLADDDEGPITAKSAAYLWQHYSSSLNLGPYVVRSETNKGFWNQDQGWVYDKRSASGLFSLPELTLKTLEAELVPYESAKGFSMD